MATSLPLPIPSSSSRTPLPSRLLIPHRLSVVCSAYSGKLNPPPPQSRSPPPPPAAATPTADDLNREALERYGFNPATFGIRGPRRGRRKDASEEEDKQEKKRGRRKGRMDAMPEKPKLPPLRETHKMLKVLAGKAHRKQLLSPKGMDVRPMMEVVRGSVFNIIQSASGTPAFLRPGRWLDLYSGTGSVGIEALSRGCVEAHFVEMDPWVVSDVLKPNLEWTGFLDASVIYTKRVETFLQQLQGTEELSFEYISVTPPYSTVDYNILMGLLEKSPLVGKDTFMIVEYPLELKLSESCKNLVKIADRRFGRTQFVVYGPTWTQKKKKKSESSELGD